MGKVTDLRKSGQLKEAWMEAQAQLSSRPNDIWAKRDFSWVIYDCLKRFTDNSSPYFHDMGAYVKTLAKARSLQLPAEEEMFFENAGGNLRAVVWSLVKEGDRGVMPLTNLLEEVILWDRRSPIFLPGTVRGLQKGLKSDASSIVKLMTWYGLDQYSNEDFERHEVDGRKIPSDAETMTHGYLKALQTRNPEGNLLFDAATLDIGIRNALSLLRDPRCEEWQWPQYSLGELLVAAGRSEEAQRFLAPLVVKKPNESWTWRAFGEAVRPESEEGFISCMFKGLLVSREAKTALSLHESALDYFIKNGMMSQAKAEALTIDSCRRENGWAASERANMFLMSPSGREVEAEKSMKRCYRDNSKGAVRLLSGLVGVTEFYVEWINPEKKTCGVVTMEEKRDYLGRTTTKLIRNRVDCLDEFNSLAEGETFNAIFDDRMRKLIGSIEASPDAAIRPHVIKEQVGIWDSFSRQDGTKGCFVRMPSLENGEDAYVPERILCNASIENGNLVRIKECLSWKKAKEGEGSGASSSANGEWVWRTSHVEDLGSDPGVIANYFPSEDFYVDFLSEDTDTVFIARLKKVQQRPYYSWRPQPPVLSIVRSKVSKAYLPTTLQQGSVYSGWVFGKERCYLAGNAEIRTSGDLHSRMIRQNIEGILDISNGWGRIGSKEDISIPPSRMSEISILPGSRVRANAYSVYVRNKKESEGGAVSKDDGRWEWRVSDIAMISEPETKNVSGRFSDSMRNFGFLEDGEGESYFISSDLIRGFGLVDGDSIEAVARKSWDRKKQRESWSVVDIIDISPKEDLGCADTDSVEGE